MSENKWTQSEFPTAINSLCKKNTWKQLANKGCNPSMFRFWETSVKAVCKRRNAAFNADRTSSLRMRRVEGFASSSPSILAAPKQLTVRGGAKMAGQIQAHSHTHPSAQAGTSSPPPTSDDPNPRWPSRAFSRRTVARQLPPCSFKLQVEDGFSLWTMCVSETEKQKNKECCYTAADLTLTQTREHRRILDPDVLAAVLHQVMKGRFSALFQTDLFLSVCLMKTWTSEACFVYFCTLLDSGQLRGRPCCFVSSVC